MRLPLKTAPAEPAAAVAAQETAAPAAVSQDVAIVLDNVSKVYKNGGLPAVDSLSLTVPRGEIVVFAGTSGCGKTTTLKLINRLIEPTSGRILLDGRNVLSMNPDRLRRGIGYVIQHVGLFPHMTIADNVATVPKMLGWPKDRVAGRVAELLSLVGIDPAYGTRYPRELSGGQAQRVGVARALAGDPPVLLMDEPFAAVDPITRVRLQQEFVSLHHQMGKTVIFVTHDIGEAILVGDRIAVFREQCRLAQYDTPVNVLTNPADEYVSDLLGTGRVMHLLACLPLSGIPFDQCPTARADATGAPGQAAASRAGAGGEHVLVVDENGRPLHFAARDPQGMLAATGPVRCAVRVETSSLRDALSHILVCPHGCAVVVDATGKALGLLRQSNIREVLRERNVGAHLTGEAALP